MRLGYPELRKRRWAADTSVADDAYEVINDENRRHDVHGHGDVDADDHGD